MSYSPIGDTIALTKLAYALYSRVVVVARDAPEQFEALLRDLDIYKGVLYRIRSQTDHGGDPSYSVAVQAVLERCFSTLYGLRDLTTKYENLAWSDRGVFFKRISWAKDQDAIKEFREKFKEHQQLLQIVLTSKGRKQLSEETKQTPIDDDEKPPVRIREPEVDVGCTCGVSPIKRTTTATTTGSATLNNPRESLSTQSPKAVQFGYQPFRERTHSSTGSNAQEALESLTLKSRSYSASTAKTSCCSCHDRVQSGGLGIGECHIAPSFEKSSNECHALSEEQPPVPDQGPLQTKTKQPLVLLRDREKHNVVSDVQKLFRDSVESVKDPTSVERWLRLAIWWLVKSRIISHILAPEEVKRRGTDASQHQNRWHSTVSAEQAYTDLLKSSWILEEVILVGAADEELSYVSVRKMIKDLSASLHNDLLENRNFDRNFEVVEGNALLKNDLHLLESFEQTIEAEESIPAAMDDPVSALRWFEIDQDNAGMQHEKVLFRTFANAQLGSRYDRSKSPSAPYMLLVWTAADDCDIFVSLCNHRGSVNLSRKLAAEDLEDYEAGDDTTLFSIKFPTQEAEIKFLSHEDAVGFFTQPRIFFAALKKIKPRSGELAIYQASLSTYGDSSPGAVSGIERARTLASSKASSCGLRVYESMPDKCWKTTRRLVVSTPPDSTKPECVSHWLPVDQIKIVVEGTKVTVKWSDCEQLRRKELGNFAYQYSYIYKADEPNRKIYLEFGSASEAQRFEKCILLPTEMPPQVTTKVEIPSAFQDIRIYRLFDVDEPDRQYHSIALSKKNPKGPHMTEIYYVYRDLDWVFSTRNGAPTIIHFPSLQTSHYVSTIPRLQYKPNASDPTPDFSHVVETFKAARFELGCDHDLKRFMHGLTGWTLKFFRPLSKLLLVETGHLIMNPKEQHKGVCVHLWEKAAEEGQPQIQLAVRLGAEIKDPWITASLFEAHCRSEHSTMSYNVEFQALLLQRGVEVDTKYMTATTRGPLSAQATSRRRWRTTLTFANTEREWTGIILRRGGGIR
ncbi:hypothetical protein HO133_009589 [Letharia lupina]|uniref:Uncharacterized protein n=1 Tax=Letharia lupina TaxID=560253 RepID=A0A8H6FF56_9LECA|nr:uncharacterized protein HO133_009589 [Letharia lupina]KAF6225589.1 hypothetical protein HO133_009589 [Letharia lupina]